MGLGWQPCCGAAGTGGGLRALRCGARDRSAGPGVLCGPGGGLWARGCGARGGPLRAQGGLRAGGGLCGPEPGAVGPGEGEVSEGLGLWSLGGGGEASEGPRGSEGPGLWSPGASEGPGGAGPAALPSGPRPTGLRSLRPAPRRCPRSAGAARRFQAGPAPAAARLALVPAVQGNGRAGVCSWGTAFADPWGWL